MREHTKKLQIPMQQQVHWFYSLLYWKLETDECIVSENYILYIIHYRNMPCTLIFWYTNTFSVVNNNSLTGTIPVAIGRFIHATSIILGNNRFTGFPSTLSKFKTGVVSLLPNPLLPALPYDLMAKEPVSSLTSEQLVNFINAGPNSTVSLTSRQVTSTSTIYQDMLNNYCNLNEATTSSDVAVGCIAAVVYICQQQSDLSQCHKYYNEVFTRSIYSSIGAACPAWKFGPRSIECNTTVSNFAADLLYTKLSQSFAQMLQKNIFTSQVYAPCKAPTCKW